MDQQTLSAGLETPYIHRYGTREYMVTEVIPHIRQALQALVVKVNEERLHLAAGVGLDDGQYQPQGWRPFCAHRWLAEYLLQHDPKPTAEAPTTQTNNVVA